MSLHKPKFGWARALIIIIPYFLFVGIFEVIGMLLMGISLTNVQELHHMSPSQNAIMQVFACVGTLLFFWAAMRILDRKPFVELGFYLKNRGKDIIAGLLLGLVIMGAGYGILSFTHEITFSEYNANWANLFWSILLFVCVAVVEETLTRGYILRNFMQSMNKYLALAVTSLLFAAMHGFNPNMSWFSFLSLFLAGIVLGITYIYTKNLWFPVALHFSWNFFQSLFGFNVSGQDYYSFIEFSIASPNSVNGGAFGFEGSYLSLIADMLVILGAVWYYQKKAKA